MLVLPNHWPVGTAQFPLWKKESWDFSLNPQPGHPGGSEPDTELLSTGCFPSFLQPTFSLDLGREEEDNFLVFFFFNNIPVNSPFVSPR